MMRGESLSDSETLTLRPTRSILATVYRTVSGGYRGEADVLGCRVKRAGVGFSAMLASLQILCEGGLLRMEDNGSMIVVEAADRNGQNDKISPENTPTAMCIGYKNV